MLIEGSIVKPERWIFPPFKDLKAFLKVSSNETRPVNVSQKPVWEILGVCFFQGKAISRSLRLFSSPTLRNHPTWRANCRKQWHFQAGMTEMETGGISCSAGVWEIPAVVTRRISFLLWERGMSSESWWGRAPKTFEMFCKVQNHNLGSWEPDATFMYLSWQNGRHSFTLSSLTWCLPKYYRIISPSLCKQSK